jgi:hypothetical protein
MLLWHPGISLESRSGHTFRRHGSTKIINYILLATPNINTYKGKHEPSAPVEKGKDAVKSPIRRSLDTSMGCQPNIGYCNQQPLRNSQNLPV